MIWNRKRDWITYEIGVLRKQLDEQIDNVKYLEKVNKVCSKCRCVFREQPLPSAIESYYSIYTSYMYSNLPTQVAQDKNAYCSRCLPEIERQREVINWARNNVDKASKCMKKAACTTNSGKRKRGAKKS